MSGGLLAGSPADRPRLAFLSQNSVLPEDNGGRIRNAAILTALAQRFQVTLVVTEALVPETAVELARRGMRVVHVPKARNRHVGYLREILGGASPAIAVQRNGSLDRWIAEHAADFDVVVAGTIARVPRLRQPALPPVVVDTHNVEHLRFSRAAAAAGSRLERLRRRTMNLGLARLERRVLRSTTTVACSEVDANEFRRMGVRDVRVVPNGVWCERFPDVRRRGAGTPTVVFVGDLGYAPNLEAADLLISRIVPGVRSAVPGCRFVIGGRGATETLRRAAAAADVRVWSPVESMQDLLADASVEVVPLLQGGGTRLKILEAFAAGLPVVSTSIGAEGIDARDGEHLLLADDPAGLVRAVVRLLNDPELAFGLAVAGRDLAEARFDWRELGDQFADEVLRAVGEQERHGPIDIRSGVAR